MHLIEKKLYFPPVSEAHEDGLLAIGGDLSTERLLLAYRNGIFPWFEDDQSILWYAPNPRMILQFNDLKISKSTQQIMRKKIFKITINSCFKEVITRCAHQKRKGQSGTWITENMISAYTNLHELGHALSVEVWQNNELVGGLYGVDLQKEKIFCGESMFSKVSNASKIAFTYLAQYLQQKEYKLIDCQVHNDHLESLGCTEISREDFMSHF